MPVLLKSPIGRSAFPGSACPVLKLYFNDVVSQLALGKITLPMEERGTAGGA
jgi:hypothetical protein